VAKSGDKLKVNPSSSATVWRATLFRFLKKYEMLEPMILAYILVTMKTACASEWTMRKKNSAFVGRVTHDHIFACPSQTQVELAMAADIVSKDIAAWPTLLDAVMADAHNVRCLREEQVYSCCSGCVELTV